MTPILQTQTEIIGFLPDALSCSVTEERNGVYEVTMTYPVAAPMFPFLAIDKFIKAKPNDTAEPQLFRIYEITKPINGIVTVNGEHISYALSHYPVDGVDYTGTAVQTISYLLAKANNNLKSPHGFSVSATGMTTVRDFSFSIGTVRSALGGTDGSVLDVFGGEYEFDNKIIKLHPARGTDTGVIIAYGKNLTDIKATTSMENSYTHLFPYAKKEEAFVFIAERTIAVDNLAGIAERVLLHDFSSDFEEGEEITPATLRTKAVAWLAENDINTPSLSITVSFLHLWQSPEYASLAALEKVSLCDTVTVHHKDLDIHIKTKVIKTVYDTLAEKYEKIELGTAKANFTDTLRQTTAELEKEIVTKNAQTKSQVTQAYMAAIDAATKVITGYSGGYLVLNPSEHPQELLIMNTADKATATKLWRWNLGGLGYSSNGYEGPYATAITMDGAINADFITTGTLTANIITAGVLKSADGNSFFNLESGLIQTNNAKITGGSIKIGSNDYYTEIAYGSLGQFASTNVKIGGLVPISATGIYSQCIYFVDNTTADSVDIAYQNVSTGNFHSIGIFKKDGITFAANLSLPSHTVFTSGERFTGYSHQRDNMLINGGYETHIVKAGAGIITDHYASYSFAEYKNAGCVTKTSGGKSYSARENLTSTSTYYKIVNNVECVGAYQAYISFYANSYGKAYVYFCYYNSSGSFYKGQLLATPWNSEVSFTGKVTIPTDAISWCVCVVPDTGHTSYWAGLRSVTLRNYYQSATCALELSDLDVEINARIDVLPSWGESVGAVRLRSGSSVSSVMEFDAGELYYNGKPILAMLQDHEDRIAALES